MAGDPQMMAGIFDLTKLHDRYKAALLPDSLI